MLGAKYGVLASNKTLRSVIEQYATHPYAGERANQRPDLLLVSDVRQRHVLIEFKRPSVAISRVHEAQAVTYRDELRHTFPDIQIILIGGRRDPCVDADFGDARATILSYAKVVSRARIELEWLSGALTSDRS